MHKLILSLVLTCVAATQVSAAETWLPDFDQNVHVYVDSKLTGRGVNFGADFEAKVQKAASVHGLSVYVIATEQGDELTVPDRPNWAADMLHTRLWNKWYYAKGFSQDRILILLYIKGKDQDICSTAARSGNYLHGLGVDRNKFYSANGPVMPVVRQYMGTDPARGLLTIIDNVNAEVTSAKTKQAEAIPQWVWIVVILAILVLLICCLSRVGGGGSGGGSGCGGGCGGGGCGGGCGGGG